MQVELRHGAYQDVLQDVFCDSCIGDPPYGAATHDGHNKGRPQIMSATGQATGRALTYDAWTREDVFEFVSFWTPRTRQWMSIFTSDDLIDAYKDAYRRCGWYAFAPVGVVQKVPRLLGDGPASWLRYLMTARPRTRAAQRWRCTPGKYDAKIERGAPIVGAKPIATMVEIVRDYSDPGFTVVDPCAGWGSTLIAAAQSGRVAIGAEANAETYRAAQVRFGLLG